jgi:hypothetical protein
MDPGPNAPHRLSREYWGSGGLGTVSQIRAQHSVYQGHFPLSVMGRPQIVVPSETEVRLSYDWSAVPEEVRQQVEFPPFSPDHLDNLLTRLAELVVA